MATEEETIDDMQRTIIKDCLRKQLEEFELLREIYCNSGEFHTDDPTVVDEITDFLNGLRTTNYRNLDYVIKLQLNDKIKCELSIELSQLYPAIEIPIFTIRTNSLTKKQESHLKKSIENYIDKEIDKNDPYVFQVISWLQDNITDLIKIEETEATSGSVQTNKQELVFTRLWIYSHHIKSKIKRSNIVRHARDYNLNGFMLPGKPGVICLEGPDTAAMDCWKIIKSWQWHKIKIINTESKTVANQEKLLDSCRFKEFREIMFIENGPENGIEVTDNKEGDEIKMSMRLFVKYLEAHKSSYMTKEIFGFEAFNNKSEIK